MRTHWICRLILASVAALGLAAWAAAAPGDPPAPAPAATPVQTPPPAEAATLADVVDRYFTWRGGEAYEHLQSIHDTAFLDKATGRQTAELWLNRQGRSRTETDTAGFKQIQIAGPLGAWRKNESGQVLDDPGASEAARRYALLEFGDALRGRGGATATLLGIGHSGAQRVAVVRVSFGDADTYDVLVDPTTGALGGYNITQKGRQGAERFSDWHMVDGVRMPFAAATFSDHNTASQFSTVELNRPLEPSLFERPTASRVASLKGASSSGWIDFDFYAKSQIYLPVKVNGHDAVALLDSGASISVLDQALAASIGLKTGGEAPVAGAERMTSSGFVRGVRVVAGGLTLGDLTTAALDLAPIRKLTDHPLQVMVGEEVFNELIVDIDFSHRRLAFRDPTSFAMPAGAIESPLLHGGLVRATPVSVEGRAPAQFQFDLGDAGALDLYPIYVKAQKLLEGRRTSQVMSFGEGGSSTDTIATLRQVEFAGVSLSDVPANFQQTQPPGTGSDQAGRIGMGVLSRFRLIIDYPHDRLYVVPYADLVTAPFDKDRLGLHLERDGDAFAVKLVSANSPAAAAGFRVGERIVSLDGKPASAWTMATERTLFDGPPGTPVGIGLEGGAVRTVNLADYY
ncbi:MAG: aspartyl protease family protein [Caulobacterales bacterium]